MRSGVDTQARRNVGAARIAALLLATALSPCAFAVAPPLTFTPLTPTSFPLATNATAIVSYLVTHQAQVTRTWQWQPMAGVTQMTGAVGACADPFPLAFQQSCQLDLWLDGSQLGSGVLGGPVVCEVGNLLRCYQPAAVDALNITVVLPPDALFADGFEAP